MQPLAGARNFSAICGKVEDYAFPFLLRKIRTR